jgi:peroxiredoxin
MILAALVACHAREPAKPAAAPEPNEGEVRAGAVGARRIGTPGPALTVRTIDGETIDLAKLYGDKPVYLKFWETWCVPCRAQMPGFERTYEAMGDQLHILAVNGGLDDDEAAVRAFRARFGLKMPIVVDDGALAAALDLTVTPQHVLIGRDGKIAYVGHVDGPPLDAAIQKVLAAPAGGAPISQAPALRPAIRPGDAVGSLEVTTIDGAKLQLGASADHQPRAVVLFSSWCESYEGLKANQPRTVEDCRRVREQLAALVGKPGVAWIGIVRGVWTNQADVAEYRTESKIAYPLVLDADGSLFRAFGVRNAPTVALIDRDGKLVRLVGPGDHDLPDAVAKLVGAN